MHQDYYIAIPKSTKCALKGKVLCKYCAYAFVVLNNTVNVYAFLFLGLPFAPTVRLFRAVLGMYLKSRNIPFKNKINICYKFLYL